MPIINDHLMDPHLNVFYSYDRGKYNSEKGKENLQKQLEDNVTRALLITLSQLAKSNRLRFIGELMGGKENDNCEEDFDFDLQALRKGYSKNAENKFLLTITKSGKVSENSDTSHDDQGSRADGWILNNNLCILIEVKVGETEVSKSQIERHITDSKGFGVSLSDVKQIHKKWQEIDFMFANLEQNLEQEKEMFFVSEFRRFLNMIGEVMNFSQFYENKDLVNDDIRNSQLRLLMDRVILELNDDEFRKYGQITNWGYFTINGDKNPHISFSITEHEIQCSLTVSESKTNIIDSFLSNQEFKKELSNLLTSDYISKARHIISLRNDRLIDRQRGQIRGRKLDTFLIKLNFCENQLNPERLNSILEALQSCSGLGKQLEFILNIRIPEDRDYSDGLMASNKELLDNPEKIVALFVEFIRAHKSLAKEIRG
jgi:ribosomal 50S subunit-associated protein YjgA (DUF615 family)